MNETFNDNLRRQTLNASISQPSRVEEQDVQKGTDKEDRSEAVQEDVEVVNHLALTASSHLHLLNAKHSAMLRHVSDLIVWTTEVSNRHRKTLDT